MVTIGICRDRASFDDEARRFVQLGAP